MMSRLRDRLILLGIGTSITLLALIIAYPLTKPLLAAAVLAYLFQPVYKRLVTLVRADWLASLITLLLIILILIIPLTSAIFLFLKELRIASASFTLTADTLLSMIRILPLPLPEDQVSFYVTSSLKTLSLKLTALIQALLINTVGFILTLMLTLFITYYLLKDWDRLGRSLLTVLRRLLRTSMADTLHRYARRVANTVNAVVYGTILIGLIQSILLIPAYWLIGVKTPILWGIITFFITIIPLFGAPLIWFPLGIIKLAQAIALQDAHLGGLVAAYFLWNMLIVSTIDNFLKPRVISSAARMHPVFILLGILGGIKLLGITGIILGPVILTAALTYYELIITDPAFARSTRTLRQRTSD